MFSKSKPASANASTAVAAPARMASGGRGATFSILGADVVVTGNVAASVDLHIDGRIDGDLICANLVQGQDSIIKGAIAAESAKLSGTVEGSINARDLTLHASARVTGDVTYENLTIEQGSQVDGRFTHRRNGASGVSGRPASTPPLLELTGANAA